MSLHYIRKIYRKYRVRFKKIAYTKVLSEAKKDEAREQAVKATEAIDSAIRDGFEVI
jgi:hypothetical protein